MALYRVRDRNRLHIGRSQGTFSLRQQLQYTLSLGENLRKVRKWPEVLFGLMKGEFLDLGDVTRRWESTSNWLEERAETLETKADFHVSHNMGEDR